jgi:hypothetical protein
MGASHLLFSDRKITFKIAENIKVDNLYFNGILKSRMLPIATAMTGYFFASTVPKKSEGDPPEPQDPPDLPHG